MSSSIPRDNILKKHLPYPLAVTWRKATSSGERGARLKQAIATGEIFLRILSGWLLCDYLNQPPNKYIDEFIETKLHQPSLGTYKQLVDRLSKHLKRSDCESFFPDVLKWYTKSKSNHIGKIVEWRNKTDGHYQWTEEELETIQPEIENMIRELLTGSSWLLQYRMFKIKDHRSRLTRQRTTEYSGSILFFTGRDKTPDSVSLKWSCQLYDTDSIYLCSPEGDRFLCLSPFFNVFRSGTGREKCLFVWSEFDKKLDLVTLKNDEDATEKSIRPVNQFQETVTLKQFLATRSEFDCRFENTLRDGFSAKRISTNIINNRYKILETVGEGSMAEVISVVDLETNVNYALKVLLPHNKEDDIIKKRFDVEFSCMSRLNHKNILKAHDKITLDNNQKALKLPLMKSSLQNFIGKAQPERVKVWLKQGLQALSFIHKQGIIHRDIKPSNLLVDQEDNLFVSDFGIAKNLNQNLHLTQANEQLGAFHYQAPEVQQHKKSSSSSDRYSLAVVFHEIMTGKVSKDPGKNIEGELGEILRILGHVNPSKRSPAQVTSKNNAGKGCIQCGAELNEYYICLGCGSERHLSIPPLQSVVKERYCPSCNTPNSPSASFCSGCGFNFRTGEPPPSSEDDTTTSQEAIQKYTEAIISYAEDSVLEDWEWEELQSLKDELNIPEDLSNRLLEPYKMIRGVPFACQLDSESLKLITIGATSHLMFSIKAQQNLKSFEVYGWVTGNYDTEAQTFRNFRKGKSYSFTMPIKAHSNQGHIVELFCRCTTKDQIDAVYKGKPVQIFIKDNSVQNITILSRTMEFDAQNKEIFDEWVEEKRALKKTPDPRIPIKNELLKGTPFSQFKMVWNNHTVEGKVGSDLSFGGPIKNAADVKLILEPIKPRAQYQTNINKSIRISRSHFKVTVSPSPMIERLENKNGTLLNGINLPHLTPKPIPNNSSIQIASVLDLNVQFIYNTHGIIQSLHVYRTNNTPEKSYLLLNGDCGIWPNQHQIIDSTLKSDVKSPLRLCLFDNELCLYNYSDDNCKVNAKSLPIGEYVPLRGQTIIIQSMSSELTLVNTPKTK